MIHHLLSKLAPALALALLACGPGSGAPSETNGGTAVENPTLAKLNLTSDAFQNGLPIPPEYSCDGANKSPALRWDEPPAGTKSFALVVDDPDAPGGTFRHWGTWDIPATTRSIAPGQSVGSQATNDFGKPGYGGPCPPKGHGPHHYHFKLFALDTDKLGLTPGAKVADVEKAAGKHALAEGELIGTFERR
jgi:Raf kinase inhibitor-like YbhB/YbcL family protein